MKLNQAVDLILETSTPLELEARKPNPDFQGWKSKQSPEFLGTLKNPYTYWYLKVKGKPGADTATAKSSVPTGTTPDTGEVPGSVTDDGSDIPIAPNNPLAASNGGEYLKPGLNIDLDVFNPLERHTVEAIFDYIGDKAITRDEIAAHLARLKDESETNGHEGVLADPSFIDDLIERGTLETTNAPEVADTSIAEPAGSDVESLAKSELNDKYKKMRLHFADKIKDPKKKAEYLKKHGLLGVSKVEVDEPEDDDDDDDDGIEKNDFGAKHVARHYLKNMGAELPGEEDDDEDAGKLAFDQAD